MPDSGDQKQQQQNLDLRVALADAYSFIEGSKSIQTFSALTFEDLVGQQIDQISGSGTPTRPNKIDQINNIATNLTQAIAQIKALPPDAFQVPDATQVVNTPATDTSSTS